MANNENEYNEKNYESHEPLEVPPQEQARQMPRASKLERARVRMVPQQVSEGEEETIAEGEVILNGRYRIVQLLYKRPRLRLYLGHRLATEAASEEEGEEGEQEPLVAIRELVLTALSSQVRDQIERAAFEEFVSPVVLGSSQLSMGGDRVWTEGERHYLVMQLYDKKSAPYSDVVTLADLLLNHQKWPSWLNEGVALSWGAQLCRIVARLQRLGVVLGDLDLATILVSSSGTTSWSPILLASWPPPPQFWQPGAAISEAIALQRQVFPDAKVEQWNAFIAPEMLNGRSDERSDVYTLGALLYLLITHYAPIAAMHRLQALSENGVGELPCIRLSEGGEIVLGAGRTQGSAPRRDGLELIQPHLLYRRISPTLEQILLRALELDPSLRYSSVFALVEALEAAELKAIKAYVPPREGGFRKMLAHRSKA